MGGGRIIREKQLVCHGIQNNFIDWDDKTLHIVSAPTTFLLTIVTLPTQ
jgi:hypothetical protein